MQIWFESLASFLAPSYNVPIGRASAACSTLARRNAVAAVAPRRKQPTHTRKSLSRCHDGRGAAALRNTVPTCHPASCVVQQRMGGALPGRASTIQIELSQFYIVFQFPDWSGNGSGNFQFPGPQRVDLEIVFIFSVDSSRVDAISGLLCSLVTAWKPKVANFFFRDGHKVGSKLIRLDVRLDVMVEKTLFKIGFSAITSA